MIEVATEDLMVNFVNIEPDDDNIEYAGDQPLDSVKITAIIAASCRATSAIATTAVTLKFTKANPCPHTLAGHVLVAGGGFITATALKARAEGAPPLRLNDMGTCAGGWSLVDVEPPAVTQPCACNLKISDAGQTKVRCK
jgi:hypothetical protein